MQKPRRGRNVSGLCKIRDAIQLRKSRGATETLANTRENAPRQNIGRHAEIRGKSGAFRKYLHPLGENIRVKQKNRSITERFF